MLLEGLHIPLTPPSTRMAASTCPSWPPTWRAARSHPPPDSSYSAPAASPRCSPTKRRTICCAPQRRPPRRKRSSSPASSATASARHSPSPSSPQNRTTTQFSSVSPQSSPSSSSRGLIRKRTSQKHAPPRTPALLPDHCRPLPAARRSIQQPRPPHSPGSHSRARRPSQHPRPAGRRGQPRRDRSRPSPHRDDQARSHRHHFFRAITARMKIAAGRAPATLVSADSLAADRAASATAAAETPPTPPLRTHTKSVGFQGLAGDTQAILESLRAGAIGRLPHSPPALLRPATRSSPHGRTTTSPSPRKNRPACMRPPAWLKLHPAV